MNLEFTFSVSSDIKWRVTCDLTDHASNPSAFQLASRWDGNKLFYRTKENDTWRPWVELYHISVNEQAMKELAERAAEVKHEVMGF